MKIKGIEIKDGSSNIYVVTFKPSLFMRIFGAKEKQLEYKDTFYTYRYGGGSAYIKKDGSELGNGNYIATAIDNFKRSW